MNTKFSQVAHLYLGCEVEVDNYYHELYGKNNKAFLIGIYGSLCYVDFYEILANGVECCVTDDSLKLSHEEIKPRLYSLADITEGQAIECELYDTNQASSCGGFDGFKESLLHSRWTSYTPTQFTQLLQWGYWLFGDEAFETGEIIKKQK